MKQMKAIVKDSRKPGATTTTVDVPTIGDMDVLIRVKAFALCKSDVDVYEWTPLVERANYALPFIMGHEFAGEVVEIGSLVTGVTVGDRVAGETHIPCGTCYTCRTGNQHICTNNMGVLGRNVDGAFAEYIRMPEISVVKLPDNLSYEQGSLLEPFATAMHAVQKASPAGKNIAILGTGTIGLMAVELAAFLGATQIIALDISDEKLQQSKKRGATTLVNGLKGDFVAAAKQQTGGTGLDAIIDFTGNERVINQAVESLRAAGTLVHVGMVEKPLTFSNFMYGVVYKELTITGIFGRRMFESWEMLFNILRTGKIDAESYIGKRMKFEQMDEAVTTFNNVVGRIVFPMEEA